MKRSLLWVVVFMCCCWVVPHLAFSEVKIGVLAKNGPAKALKKWAATGEYLTEKLGQPITITPLDFDEVFAAIESKKVDFFLVNSSMFVTAQVKFGAVPVATMINSRQGKALNSFGGVILTSAYNDAINELTDIKGKKFVAVQTSSFGGWQMAYKEFIDQGIDPYKDFNAMDFAGKHDNVVFAIQNEEYDAGTVRTDTLERMVASGAIAMEDFKILAPKNHPGFPFVCSTALYPEWPLAKLAETDPALSDQIVAALKALTPEDSAAKAAKIVGWSDPLDYSGIEQLQKSLKIGAYAQ